MTHETRQYRLVRLAAAVFGLATFGSLVLIDLRAWPIVHQALFPTKLGCGCEVMTMIAPPAVIATAVLGLAASVLMISRCLIFFIRQIRRSQRLTSELLAHGRRQIYHHGLAQSFILLKKPGRAAMTVGLFRPRIYLTTDLVHHLSGTEVQAVLRHEQAHRRRFDPLWLAVMDSLSAAWWRLPWLQQWVEASFTLRELSADAVATGGYQHLDGLSGAILKLAGSPPMVGLAAFSPNHDRVEKLLNQGWQPQVTLWRWSYALGIGVIGLALSLFVRMTPAMATTVSPTAALVCHETRLLCPERHLWPDSRRCVGGPGKLCVTVEERPMSIYVYPWTP